MLKGNVTPNQSIEERFQEELDKGNYKPIDKLIELVRNADMHCAPSIERGSPYMDFFEWSPQSPILTFNYDGLAETLARQLGQWRPRDGFGLEVEESLPRSNFHPHKTDHKNFHLPETSSRKILHLHGSLYIMSLQRSSGARYLFDPNTATNPCFFPYLQPAESYGPDIQFPQDRVIVPVPDKAEGLNKPFIRETYARAEAIMANAEDVTAIGYSFNRNDASSYTPLLRRLRGKTVRLVAPDACELTRGLGKIYPEINWRSLPYRFETWAKAGFP